MLGRMRFPGKVLIVTVVTLAALAVSVAFWGCAKRPAPGHEDHEGHEHAHAGHEHASAAPKVEAALAAEQTTCPVMGGAVNKAIFVEYKGKKVYFCCKGCDQTFQQNPEKYLAKLPQFQGVLGGAETGPAHSGHQH